MQQPQCSLASQQTVVFKRWSRKRYAVFAGLHKNVVIGVLKADICDAALLKTEGVIRSEQQNVIRLGNDAPEEAVPEEFSSLCGITMSDGEYPCANNIEM